MNPLQVGPQAGSPPAPRPDAGPLQSGAMPTGPAPAAGTAPLQGAPPPMPAPSHGQTVAALRHLTAVQGVLEELARNPELGKSDVKSAIIDGATRLVADRVFTPGQAVVQLGTVPERPFDQREWVEEHLAQTIVAQTTILEHHRGAHAGIPEEMMDRRYDRDKHTDAMSGLMSHYGGLKNG